jgi:hypothetical protein
MLYAPGERRMTMRFSLLRSGPGRVVLPYSINIATLPVNVKRKTEKKIRFYLK